MIIQSLLLHIIAGIGGLWLAIQFVPNVVFTGSNQLLLIIGLVLGILNTTLKPLLNLITLPIRILTLGLSSFLINLLLVWALQLVFPEIEFEGFLPLLWTTLIIWGITVPLSIMSKGRA